jgi:hypothetical protein
VNYSTNSIGVSFQGEVCPRCRVAEYHNTFTIWHGVLAIFFFPIGLLVLLFPAKTCLRCNEYFGAGETIATIVRIIALLYLAFLILLIFGFCAIFSNATR